MRQQWNQKALCDFGGDAYTYADVAKSIEQFRLFLGEAGITKRSKVAICARNCARWAMTFWDINVNECVAVPLLADFHPNGISTFTHHSDSVLLFTDKEIWEKLNPGQMPNLRAAINVKDRTMLWHRDELVAEAWENRERAFARKHPAGLMKEQISYPSGNMDKLAIINYTSGTTGNPKGVMLTYGAISDTDAFANSHFPNEPGETIVSMLPMAHMYGLAIEFIHPNVDGVTVWFLGKTPSPSTLLKAMQEVKPYMVVTVPLVMEKVYANSIKPALDKMKWLTVIPQARKAIFKLIRKKVLVSQQVFDVYVRQLNEDLWTTVMTHKGKYCGCLFFLSNYNGITSRNTDAKEFAELMDCVVLELKGNGSIESSIRRRDETKESNIQQSYKYYNLAEVNKNMEKKIFMLRNDCKVLLDGFQPVLDAMEEEKRQAQSLTDSTSVAA